MTAALLVAAPAPSPTPAVQVDPNLGSPGILGFVFTFVLALVLIALVLSLSRHLRTVDRNARLATATDGADAAPGTATAGATVPSDASDPVAAVEVREADGRGDDEPEPGDRT